jgi:histidine phosphotransferase ChpT
MISGDDPESGDTPEREKRMLAMLDALAGKLCQEVSRPLGTLIGALATATVEAGAPPTGEQGGLAQGGLAQGGLALAGATASALEARLRLVRAAWSGTAGPLDVSGLQAMAAGLPGQRRARVDTAGLAPDAVFAAPLARLMLNALMLADEALPAGGTIHLSGDPRRDLVVMLEGLHAAWPPGFAACLADLEAVTGEFAAGGHLQAPLTVLVAAATGVRLSLMFGPPGLPPPLLIQPGELPRQ